MSVLDRDIASTINYITLNEELKKIQLKLKFIMIRNLIRIVRTYSEITLTALDLKETAYFLWIVANYFLQNSRPL